jgi:hypothetical protein
VIKANDLAQETIDKDHLISYVTQKSQLQAKIAMKVEGKDDENSEDEGTKEVNKRYAVEK